jgi:hypothetical protein
VRKKEREKGTNKAVESQISTKGEKCFSFVKGGVDKQACTFKMLLLS